MKEEMRKIKGYIYKITNLINQKYYIGQTTKSVKKRWNDHKRTSNRKECQAYNYPLYKAMRKYGIDNFIVETIEECDVSILDEREIYWIKIYDSTSKKGYNQTLGGGGTKRLVLDEEEIIDTYKKENNTKKIAKKFNCCSQVINQILRKYNVEVKTTVEQNMEKGYDVIQYDENHNELRHFKTKGDATKWLIEQKISNSSYNATRMAIREAILNDYKMYGFYWDSPFYSEEDKKVAKEKKKAIDTQYYKRTTIPSEHYRNITISNKHINKDTIKDNTCIVCHKLISSKSKMCLECTHTLQRNQAIQQRENIGITRDFLKNKIRHQSFLSIGKEFSVSDNTIRKWCKTYGLPYKSLEIKKYTDEEWEMI